MSWGRGRERSGGWREDGRGLIVFERESRSQEATRLRAPCYTRQKQTYTHTTHSPPKKMYRRRHAVHLVIKQTYTHTHKRHHSHSPHSPPKKKSYRSRHAVHLVLHACKQYGPCQCRREVVVVALGTWCCLQEDRTGRYQKGEQKRPSCKWHDFKQGAGLCVRMCCRGVWACEVASLMMMMLLGVSGWEKRKQGTF